MRVSQVPRSRPRRVVASPSPTETRRLPHMAPRVRPVATNRRLARPRRPLSCAPPSTCVVAPQSPGPPRPQIIVEAPGRSGARRALLPVLLPHRPFSWIHRRPSRNASLLPWFQRASRRHRRSTLRAGQSTDLTTLKIIDQEPPRPRRPAPLQFPPPPRHLDPTDREESAPERLDLRE